MPAPPSFRTFLLRIAAVLALAFAVPVGCMAGWSWLAFGRDSFGPWDPRVLLLVRGTWTESIGLVEPERSTLHYESEAADGPGVGFLRATYRTRAEPDAVLAAFAAGCARLGLAVEPDREPPPDSARRLGCTKDYLTITIAVIGQEVSVIEDVP